MFSFTELQSVHIEISNRCQARCPMCSRNHHGGIDNPLLQESDWTIEEFIQIFSKEVKQQINKITFCGNFGDPLLNFHLVKMLNYVKDDNIYVDIHTNGSLRNEKFWKELPKHLPLEHKVVFALDGLADTHKRYRIGTDYNKIINNARAFINAGGTAEWSMIRFKHNAEQVQAAKEVSKYYGFKYFTVKDSSRFALEDKFDVKNNLGQVIDTLEPYEPQPTIDLSDIPALVEKSVIDCWAKKQYEVYIDAHLDLMPCCFLASIPYNWHTKQDQLYDTKEKIKSQYEFLITDLGDTNLRKQSIREVISKPSYTSVWKRYWTTQKLYTCARTCGQLAAQPSQQVAETSQVT